MMTETAYIRKATREQMKMVCDKHTATEVDQIWNLRTILDAQICKISRRKPAQNTSWQAQSMNLRFSQQIRARSRTAQRAAADFQKSQIVV